MASLPRLFKPVFADTVEQGDVLATDMTGSEQYQVIEIPFRSINIVGGRTYVHMKVQLVGTTTEGFMILRPSECVYRRTDQEAQAPA